MALPVKKEKVPKKVDRVRPGADGFSRKPSGKSRFERLNDAANSVREVREKEMESEPFNRALADASPVSRRLADGLVNIFRQPDEPDIDESRYGLANIDIVRFLRGSNVPFDEEIPVFGKPSLALDMTIDASGSMTAFYPSLRQLSAILLSAFQQIGRKAELSITVDGRDPDSVKGFDQRASYDQLNSAQGEVERKIGEGGSGIHLIRCVEKIISKYKKTSQKNKLSLIFTDNIDTEGAFTYNEIKKQYEASPELKEKLDEADKMGIDLLFIGFPGHEHVAIMKHYALIDKEDPDSMIDLLLNVAKLKAKTGRLPPGNLGKHFDMARHGARNEASHEIARREAAKRRTLARKAAAEPRLEQARSGVSEPVRRRKEREEY